MFSALECPVYATIRKTFMGELDNQLGEFGRV